MSVMGKSLSEKDSVLTAFSALLKTNVPEKVESALHDRFMEDQIILLNEYLKIGSDHLPVYVKASYEQILGSMYRNVGKYAQSDSMFVVARKKFESIKYQDGVVNCNLLQAQLKIRLGIIDENVLVLNHAYEYFTQKHDTVRMLDILGSMAYAAGRLQEIEKSQSYWEELITIAKLAGNCLEEANGYRSKASILGSFEKYDEALRYLDLALEVRKTCNKKSYEDFEAMVLVSKANIQISLDSLTDPDSIYLKAQNSFKESGNKYWNAYLFSERASNKLRLGENEFARDLALEGYLYSEKNGLQKEISDNLGVLYNAYESLGDYENAYKYYKLFTIKSAEIISEEGKKASLQVDMQIQNEREKFQMELEYHQRLAKERNRKRIMLYSGLVIILVSGGLWSRLRFVRKAKKIIEKEKEKSDELLLNILPVEIAEELKMSGKSEARNYEMATILFTDFKEFTQTSERLSAAELVSEIDHCFKAFDAICDKYGIEKIKTIGDSYMAVGGLPVPADESTRNTVLAGIEMTDYIIKRKSERDRNGMIPFEMRVGIHSGPVVAGIVGVKKFQYDLWGDTVNTASRMESHGHVGRTNISQSTYELIKNDPMFSFEARGGVEAKGKGEMHMYFVDRK